MGLILLVAGVKKLAEGVAVTAGHFAAWSIPLPGVSAPFVAGLETVGGALLLIGLGTRWLGLLFALEFLVAAGWVKFRLFGWDFGRVDLMLVAGGVLLFLNGGGRAAVDRHARG
jgi:putative oxidoreductase